MRLPFFISILLVITATSVWAHPHGLNDLFGEELPTSLAEYFVENDEIRLRLEVHEGHFPFFSQLLATQHKPGELSTDPKLLKAATTDLQSKLKLKIGQKTLTPKITTVRLNVPDPNLIAAPGRAPPPRTFILEAIYAKTGQPKKLSLIPSLDKTDVAFTVYLKQVPVNALGFLTDEASFDLDWQDPWNSLSLTAALAPYPPTPVRAFYYLEPPDLRQEIIVRPADLKPWLDLNLRGIIKPKQKNAILEKVCQFFSNPDHVVIDSQGEPLPLISAHGTFVRMTSYGLEPVIHDQPVPSESALIGITLRWQANPPARPLTLRWQLLNESLPEAWGSIYYLNDFVNNVEPLHTIQYPNRELPWHDLFEPEAFDLDPVLLPSVPFRFSFVSLGFVILALVSATFLLIKGKAFPARTWTLPFGLLFTALITRGMLVHEIPLSPASVPVPNNHEARRILNPALRAIYHSFTLRREEQIYDALAAHAKGDVLRTLYLQIRESLALEEQAGIFVRVESIHLRSARITENEVPDGFECLANWSVRGRVTHWGHTHQRTNHYKALLSFAPDERRWKIIHMKLLEERRASNRQ